MEFALIVWAITTVIPSVNTVAGLFVMGFIVTQVVLSMVGFLDNDQKMYDRMKSIFRSCKVWFLAALLALVLIPSQKAAWMIAGAGAAQAVATSDFATELGSEAKDMLKVMMQRGTAELREQLAEEAAKVTTKEGK